MEERKAMVVTDNNVDLPTLMSSLAQTIAACQSAIYRALSSDTFKHISTEVMKLGEYIHRNQGHIQSFFEALHHLPEKIEKGVSELAHRGWFIDGEMDVSSLFESVKLANEGKMDLVEAKMVAHFEEQIDAIEERLVTFAPTREPMFRSAFAAIRRGDDIMAVPMLFIQADGLCHDHGLGSFFMRDKSVPAAMKRLGDEGIRKTLMLAPVFQILPLYMNQQERGPSFIGLNRHQVLHGESTNYGTHANSLRAASFLNFIALLLMDWKNQTKTSETLPSKSAENQA